MNQPLNKLLRAPVNPRIYAPITDDFAISTDYIRTKKGDQPSEMEPHLERTSTLIELGYPVDPKYRFQSMNGQAGEEEAFELNVDFLLPDTKDESDNYIHEAKGYVYIGSTPDGMIVAYEAQHTEGVAIGGKFGTETLTAINQFAAMGAYFRIDAMHVDAGSDDAFKEDMTYTRKKINGDSKGDTSIPFKKSLAGDNQLTIRTMTGLNIILDGFSYVKVPLFRGIPVNFTLSGGFMRR